MGKGVSHRAVDAARFDRATKRTPKEIRDRALGYYQSGSLFGTDTADGIFGLLPPVRAGSAGLNAVEFGLSFFGKRGIIAAEEGAVATGTTTLRGSLNPTTAAAARNGIQAHKAWNPGPGFEKEFTLQSGKRADAVDLVAKVVKEYKPNTPSGLTKGIKQVDGYRQELESTYGGTWTSIIETYQP